MAIPGFLLSLAIFVTVCGAIPEEQLLGFEGAEMKLSCPTADTSNKPSSFAFDWYKAKHNGTKLNESTQVALYQVAVGLQDGPHYRGDLAGGRAKLDLDDGSLTIHQLQLSDEHWYTCEMLTTIGNIFLTVNVQPSSLSLIQEPQGQLQENTTVTFICTIERTKPAGEDLYWMVGTTKVEGVKSQTSNPDGTFKMENVLSFIVNKDYAGTDVQCVFLYTEDNTKTEIRKLDVYYRPYGAPSISGDESSYIGGTVMLTCDTSNVDASVITEYIWEKVGHGEVARTPTATWQWNVQSLDDAGNFTCQVLNDLGSSEKSDQAELVISEKTSFSSNLIMIVGVSVTIFVLAILGFLIFILYRKGHLTCIHSKSSGKGQPKYVYENDGHLSDRSTNEAISTETPQPEQSGKAEPYEDISLHHVQNRVDYEDLSHEVLHCDPSSVQTLKAVYEDRYLTWHSASALNLLRVPENGEVLVKTLKDSGGWYGITIMKDDIKTMKGLEHHENILQMIGFCLSEATTKPFIVFESAALGTLGEYIAYMHEEVNTESEYYNLSSNVSHSNTQQRMSRFGMQIATGLNYLFKKKMLHPALDCSQVWITSSMVCKLTGFVTKQDAQERIEHEKHLISRSDMKYAPETRNKAKVSIRSNVWSYGTMLWQIFSWGKAVPHKGKTENLDIPPGCPDDIYSIIVRCWQWAPSSRPTTKSLEKELTEIFGRSHLSNTRTYEDIN